MALFSGIKTLIISIWVDHVRNIIKILSFSLLCSNIISLLSLSLSFYIYMASILYLIKATYYVCIYGQGSGSSLCNISKKGTLIIAYNVNENIIFCLCRESMKSCRRQGRNRSTVRSASTAGRTGSALFDITQVQSKEPYAAEAAFILRIN